MQIKELAPEPDLNHEDNSVLVLSLTFTIAGNGCGKCVHPSCAQSVGFQPHVLKTNKIF